MTKVVRQMFVSPIIQMASVHSAVVTFSTASPKWKKWDNGEGKQEVTNVWKELR